MSKNRSGNKNTGPSHNRYKHGMAGTPTYRTWANMKERCNRPENKNYENYGGQGDYIRPTVGKLFRIFLRYGHKAGWINT